MDGVAVALLIAGAVLSAVLIHAFVVSVTNRRYLKELVQSAEKYAEDADELNKKVRKAVKHILWHRKSYSRFEYKDNVFELYFRRIDNLAQVVMTVNGKAYRAISAYIGYNAVCYYFRSHIQEDFK